MNQLYRKCQSAGIRPQHVAEVGVYLPGQSNVLNFIDAGSRATLVEADPVTCLAIQAYFSHRPDVVLHAVAVADDDGPVELIRREASTFMSRLTGSPAIVNDRYVVRDADRFVVEGIRFSQLDDGTIDLLSVDIEGAEWLVIKHLVSRPAVLSVETHGKFYDNPNLAEILAWTVHNGYAVWFKNDSDTAFLKKDFRPVTFAERTGLRLTEARFALYRRWKRFIHRR